MTDFDLIEFPIRVLYQTPKLHKIDYPYEFRNKLGKDVYGIVRGIKYEAESGCEVRIWYEIEMQGEIKRVLVNHDTNQEI